MKWCIYVMNWFKWVLELCVHWRISAHLYLRNCQDLKPEEVFLLCSSSFKSSNYQKSFFIFFLCFILGGRGGCWVSLRRTLKWWFLLVSTVNQDEICSFWKFIRYFWINDHRIDVVKQKGNLHENTIQNFCCVTTIMRWLFNLCTSD